MTIEGRDWRNRERITLGCVPKKQQSPPEMAPTDLRKMALPESWNTMQELRLTDGNTEYIPNLPDTLRTLDIEKNRIRELPKLPDTLEIIHISMNQLNSLPNIPKFCRILDAKHNLLDSIPTPIPKNLRSLHLTHNYIRKLPDLNETQLERVGLGFNALTALPKFPIELQVLGCSHNKLTEISKLPGLVRVLVCSHNPNLQSLQIENLTSLELLIASSCGLKRIPLLPNPMGNDDDVNDDDNNDNNNEQGNEREISYNFDNNPLEPRFLEIYRDYKRTDSSRLFRRAVLREHRRILAEQKTSLSAIQEVFKPPYRAEQAGETEEEARRRRMRQEIFFGGPGNLIASFLSGKKGPLEAQKIDLLKNQEALRVVPKGTAAAAVAKIANIAVNPVKEKNMLARNLQERAKQYVGQKNIQAAKKRFEEKMKEILAKQKLDNKRTELLKKLVEVQGRIAIFFEEKDDAFLEFTRELSSKKKFKHLLRLLPDIESDNRDLARKLVDTVGQPPILNSLIFRTLKNNQLRKYGNLVLQQELLKNLMENLRILVSQIQDNPKFAEVYEKKNNEMFDTPDIYVEDRINTIESIAERIFPEFRTPEQIKMIETDSGIQDIYKNIEPWLVKLLIYNFIPREEEIKPPKKNNNNDNNGNVDNGGNDGDHGNYPINRGDFPDEELRKVMDEVREAQAEFAQAVNDNEEEGEALRHALRAEAEEAEEDEVELDEEDRAMAEAIEAELAKAVENEEFNNDYVADFNNIIGKEQGLAAEDWAAHAEQVPPVVQNQAAVDAQGVPHQGGPVALLGEDGIIRNQQGRVIAEDEGQQALGRLLARQARPGDRELLERQEDEARIAREDLEERRERARERMRERMRERLQGLRERHGPDFLKRRQKVDEENKVPENNENNNENSEESEENERVRALEEEEQELQREQFMLEREPGDNPDANARRLAEIARRIDEIEREIDEINDENNDNDNNNDENNENEEQRNGPQRLENLQGIFERLQIPIANRERLIRIMDSHRNFYERHGFSLEEQVRHSLEGLNKLQQKRGGRQNRTPRKQKSSRQTRRH